MSDYTRVNERVIAELWNTRNADTVGDAAAILTPAVLDLLADEVWRWAVAFLQPPVTATWPPDAEADLSPREAYLRGWAAASDVLRARTATLRREATEGARTDTPV